MKPDSLGVIILIIVGIAIAFVNIFSAFTYCVGCVIGSLVTMWVIEKYEEIWDKEGK